jgi:hypothetical protein
MQRSIDVNVKNKEIMMKFEMLQVKVLRAIIKSRVMERHKFTIVLELQSGLSLN